MNNTIKTYKGVVYFPHRQMAVDYATHCGFPNARPIQKIKGWALKVYRTATATK